MKILALIPARGGSKRLPGKNIKLLGDKPLIAWTINAASQSGVCTFITVSTDDEDIAQVARAHGALVPGLRPAQLSTDTAGSVEVALHALEVCEREHGVMDGLLLLQPTSPFRSAMTIQKAVALFTAHGGARSIVSMAPASVHPAWCFQITSAGVKPFLAWEHLQQRSQDLPSAWTLNGAIYLVSPSRLRSERTFLPPDVIALEMANDHESIDIDTQEDWVRAEAALPAVMAWIAKAR